MTEDEPKIAVGAIRRSKELHSGHWSFGWGIRNLTDEPMSLIAVRLPHGQFRNQQMEFHPPLEVRAGESAAIETSVQCSEPSGTVIENAFLILLSEWRGQRWRIFARLRVTINQRAEPEPVSELITTQRVGFSRGS